MNRLGTPVFINAQGRLGTATSSARFKDEIKLMGEVSGAILALKPVTFHYKKELDPDGAPQFGFVAEDVAKVNPALVIRDAEGKVYTVRYDAVNAMLLNEFLKEHRTVQEQNRKIQAQDATIARLESGNGGSHRNGERAGIANPEGERRARAARACAAKSPEQSVIAAPEVRAVHPPLLCYGATGPNRLGD